MRITYFPDDTRIRTNEDRDYKRTVYLLDHKVTLIQQYLLTFQGCV